MSIDEKTILQIRNTAKSAIPSGSKAILFGSRARGDAHQDSDWDILILLDKDHLDQTDYDKKNKQVLNNENISRTLAIPHPIL